MEPKFKIGDRIRVTSSDRAGYAYATVTGAETDYGPKSVYHTYKVTWDWNPFAEHSYKSEDVEDIWEVVTGCPIAMSTTTLPRGAEPIDIEFKDIEDDGTCRHKWVDYQGFNTSYQFCDLCDEKKSM